MYLLAESPGHCSDTYGDLLVLILLEKLPGEVQRNLAREHCGDAHWSLPNLRSLIGREGDSYYGNRTNQREKNSDSTNGVFHTGNGKKHPKSRNKTLAQTYSMQLLRQAKSDR